MTTSIERIANAYKESGSLRARRPGNVPGYIVARPLVLTDRCPPELAVNGYWVPLDPLVILDTARDGAGGRVLLRSTRATWWEASADRSSGTGEPCHWLTGVGDTPLEALAALLECIVEAEGEAARTPVSEPSHAPWGA